MADVTAFGVGSLFFEYLEDDGTSAVLDMSAAGDYFSAVSDALERLPSVDNIAITPPVFDLGRRTLIVGNSLPLLPNLPHTSGRPHPWGGELGLPFADGRIRFDVRIPRRLQLESGFGRDAMTDTFRLDLRFTDSFPVTFVEPVGAPPEAEPTNAVAIVRDFLESEFQQHEDEFGRLTFCYLGPSPFHSDFYIRPAMDETTAGIGYVVTRSPAYDRVDIRYARASFDTATAAYAETKLQVTPTLGLYYELVNYRNLLLSRWVNISHGADNLYALYRSTGLMAFVRRAFMAGGLVRRVSLDALEAEADLASIVKAAHDLHEREALRGVLPVVQSYLSQEIDTFPDVVPPRIAEIIALLDSLHERFSQATMLVLSSLLGGVAGAAITAIVSK
jgi:hypothetical protein